LTKSKVGVVIPCYIGGDVTIQMVSQVIKYADLVVVVDDCCPLNTGNKLLKKNISPKVNVIHNKQNMGVGGATKRGFEWLLDHDCEIIIKIDADNQMKPEEIPKMIEPILNKECEATKGNRFTNPGNLLEMPKIRLIGNTLLSYMTKFSTGYWEIFDPTNGFIAFKSEVLRNIDLRKTDDKYFFETDILFRCGLKNIKIKNIEVDISYKDIYSSLNPIKELPRFLVKNLKLTIKRIIYQYYLLDFNAGSIELILSFLSALLSGGIALYSLYQSYFANVYASAGTVGLFTIFTIISLQLFLSFIYYDCSTKVLFRAIK